MDSLDGSGSIPFDGIIHNLILSDVPFLCDGVSLDGRGRSSDVPHLVGRSRLRVVWYYCLYLGLLLLLLVTLCTVWCYMCGVDVIIVIINSVLCVVLSSIRTQLSNKLKLANDFNFVQINVLCVQI